MKSIGEGKSKESIRATGDDARNLPVSERIIGMKRGEEHGLRYPSLRGAKPIFVQRRGGIPRSGQPVAFASMAVTVYDHEVGSGCIERTVAARGGPRHRSAQMIGLRDVAMLQADGGPCRRHAEVAR